MACKKHAHSRMAAMADVICESLADGSDFPDFWHCSRIFDQARTDLDVYRQPNLAFDAALAIWHGCHRANPALCARRFQWISGAGLLAFLDRLLQR